MSEPIVPAEYVGKPLEFIMQRENKKLRLKRDIKKWVSKNRDKRCKTCEHARKKCERTLDDVACRSSVCLTSKNRCSWSDDELFERIASVFAVKRGKFDVLASQLPKPPSSSIPESEQVHTDLLTTYFVPLKTPSSIDPSRAGSAVSSELSQPPDSDFEEPLRRTERLAGSSQSHYNRSSQKESVDVGTSQEKEVSPPTEEDKTTPMTRSKSPTSATRFTSQLSDLQEKLRETESRLHDSTNQVAALKKAARDANEKMNAFRDKAEQLTSANGTLQAQLVSEMAKNIALQRNAEASLAKSARIHELEREIASVKASQEALQREIQNTTDMHEKHAKEDVYDLNVTQRSLEYALANAKDMDGLRKTIELQLSVLDGVLARRIPLKVSQETGQASAASGSTTAVGNSVSEGRSWKRQKTSHISESATRD